jgi:hypothetical protein
MRMRNLERRVQLLLDDARYRKVSSEADFVAWASARPAVSSRTDGTAQTPAMPERSPATPVVITSPSSATKGKW